MVSVEGKVCNSSIRCWLARNFNENHFYNRIELRGSEKKKLTLTLREISTFKRTHHQNSVECDHRVDLNHKVVYYYCPVHMLLSF